MTAAPWTELTAPQRACPHTLSTLVATRQDGWEPVEVFACDACGARREIRMLHEAEDCGFAPEPVGGDWP